MQIFADHCVHSAAVVALRENGHDILRAVEVSMAAAPDEQIFQYAKETSRVLFTFDKDFGNITRFNIQDASGVVILYVERMSRDMLLKRSIDFFKNTSEDVLKKKLFILEPEETRVWPKT